MSKELFEGRETKNPPWMINLLSISLDFLQFHPESDASFKVVTQLDTPKSDYRERSGTKWLVLGF